MHLTSCIGILQRQRQRWQQEGASSFSLITPNQHLVGIYSAEVKLTKHKFRNKQGPPPRADFTRVSKRLVRLALHWWLEKQELEKFARSVQSASEECRSQPWKPSLQDALPLIESAKDSELRWLPHASLNAPQLHVQDSVLIRSADMCQTSVRHDLL